MTDRDDGRSRTPEEGNPLSLSDLAAKHGDRLVRAAWFLCRDRQEAEDLVQETFFEAIHAAARFEGRSAPYTWLYGIMRRRFLLHCRGRRRFLHWLSLAGTSVPTAEMASHERDERLDPMMRAVLTLPIKHREVLLLRYIDGRKIADIAGMLRISEGTVKSRLHHALRRAKTAISLEGETVIAAAAEKAHEL
jgi:RNA polymerase sigma-70 factor (ECF subfamily)